jgi:hypothetical protein
MRVRGKLQAEMGPEEAVKSNCQEGKSRADSRTKLPGKMLKLENCGITRSAEDAKRPPQNEEILLATSEQFFKISPSRV